MVKKANSDTYEGRLPATAPLANPYVPFQKENPTVYDPKEALVRGTLFPGLDLPFMGMVNQVNKNFTPLMQLQTLAFGLQELALYLDTHREDRQAYEMFQTYRKLYDEARKTYAQEYGPLSLMEVTGEEYDWLNDPWPWEYAENRGV